MKLVFTILLLVATEKPLLDSQAVRLQNSKVINVYLNSSAQPLMAKPLYKGQASLGPPTFCIILYSQVGRVNLNS